FCQHPPAPALARLSLHDALPISAATLEAGDVGAEGKVLVLALAECGAPLDPVVLQRRAPVFFDLAHVHAALLLGQQVFRAADLQDRKSTRLNSSHEWISYAVFCL